MAFLDNLEAHWRFEESSGTRFDTHGSNDLSDNNTVAQHSGGIINNATAYVRTSSEFLDIADNTSLSMGDIDFTLAGWVYLDSKTSNLSIIGRWTGAGDKREYLLLYLGGATDRFHFTVSADGTGTATTINADNHGAVSTGTWIFVVVWHDASANTINIQVNDGSIDSTAHTAGVNDSDGRFDIGATEESLDFWDGRLDSWSVWKRVLSSAEKTDLYNGGLGLDYPFITDEEGLEVFRPRWHPTQRSKRHLSHSRIFVPPTVFNPPSNFRVESRTPTSVRLAWGSEANFSELIEIERALGDGSFTFVVRMPSAQLEYTDKNLAIGTRYRYRIRTV